MLRRMQSLRGTLLSLLRRPSAQTTSLPASSKFLSGPSAFTKLISPPHITVLAELCTDPKTKSPALQAHSPWGILYKQVSLAVETPLQLHSHCWSSILLPEPHALHRWSHRHLSTGDTVCRWHHGGLLPPKHGHPPALWELLR